MNERVADLISQVRTYVGEINTIEPQMLYNRFNRVQNQIFREIRPEIEFKLNGIDYVEGFEFGDQKTFLLKKIFNNWQGDLTKVDPSKWDVYKDTSYGYPVYYTIFNSKLYLAPAPLSGQNLTIWAHQMELLNKMNDDVPPELPTYCDEALILGTAAKYNIEFEGLFRQELDRVTSLPHLKDTGLRTTEMDW